MSETSYFSIGGLAAQLDVSPSAIRKWEAEGLIPAAARLAGSDRRLYSVADLQTIRARLEERRARRIAAAPGNGGAPVPTAA